MWLGKSLSGWWRFILSTRHWFCVLSIESSWCLQQFMPGMWGWLWWNDVWSGMILIILHTNQFNTLKKAIKVSGASGFCSILIYTSIEVLSSVGNLQIWACFLENNPSVCGFDELLYVSFLGFKLGQILNSIVEIRLFHFLSDKLQM